MPTAEWERGYAAGYHYAMISKGTPSQKMEQVRSLSPKSPKPKRKPSAYNRAYSRAFAKVSGRFKNKKGGWKKGGYRSAVKAAHKLAGK